MPDTLVLAGDIGGTKSNLAFFRGPSRAPETVAERSYQNRDFASLDEVVGRFRADTGLAAATACFGVAGAVVGGASQLPNLGWQLSETDLARELGLEFVRLLNDLEANALGIASLPPEQFFTLNPGQSRAGGNRALIAAGTGLGMALLVQDGTDYRVSASEGGHMDFAPRNEEEVGLWRFLAARLGRVSVERVVSGRGLVAVYDFLKTGGMDEPEGLAARLEVAADRAAVIAQAGSSGEAAICVKALDLFLSAYGAAAGNLALMALATGGLYIGGGIAPKLIDVLPKSGFMAAFKDKGRFTGLLSQMPVRVILEPRTALYGAASQALRHTASNP
ncbi:MULTISPECIES: glucokinase [unclassified Thiobacillus]|uniref:glucokinase n=1 Tax=unclassified Thiobacillus TaxID=2646513 RepID=UPI00095FD35F|nr:MULTISPECIES: glucokinase [unclassified Thiobacillus]MBN8781190.1 glucokinase [Thiobacillus sp.]OJY56656.1 MAG: glucokinase [Thiobacillus sp. 0-1251]